jgi:hypothetical protein
MQKHRISTNIGKDQKVVVELKNDFDLLEILSLKFTQTEAYSSMCADYGVVCGRIFVNNGFGVPNARVSIFIPISEEDSNDPVISALYPFTTVDDRNENGYRYNLLPSRKQHGGHEPTGTFPDQKDILTREEVLEVYEKYYKYTVKTNDAGDFMIWGVPVGIQTIHVDVDLSDIGCFSLRPDDFIRQGLGVDKFKNTYSYKSSNDLDTLPQIVSFNQTVEVYPFWGNEDLCEIGLTRTDFDLSSKGVKVEPKAYLLGSIYSDKGKNTINKNCRPQGEMGRKCDLTTFDATIEILRFTPNKDTKGRPILERYEIQEDIEEDGSFVVPLPMNMDFIFTNEFGENEITNDPNKGIPTSACYRFRISGKNQTLGRVRYVASYLLPNIREYNSDVDGSYAFSLDWDDYPTSATSSSVIFNQTYGSYFPEDYFYRFSYNKVYSVTSYRSGHFKGGKDNFLGIKDIAPKAEEDCESSVVTPPINYAWRKFSFAILLAIIINAFERVIYTAFVGAIQIIIIPFQFLWEFRIYIRALGATIINWRPFGFFDGAVIEPLQALGTVHLSTVVYPECESCDEIQVFNENPTTESDPSLIYQKVGSGRAVRDKLTFLVNCTTYNLNVPTTGTTTYNWIDCTTNIPQSVSIPFSGSPTNGICARDGSLSYSGGDGTPSVVGTCDSTVTDVYIADPLNGTDEYILSETPSSGLTQYDYTGYTYGQSLTTIYNNYLSGSATGRTYYVKLLYYIANPYAQTSDITTLGTLTTGTTFELNINTYTSGSTTGYLGLDTGTNLSWRDASIPKDYVWTGFTYEIYDNYYPTTGSSVNSFDSTSLPEGCLSQNTIYDDSGIVPITYCASGVTADYNNSSQVIANPGTNCNNLNLMTVGQVAANDLSKNPCSNPPCDTRSGFSEFRFGVYTVIPAAHADNRNVQFKLIREYARRKLVNKVFCEGIANYSFFDNWLAGSLYMFPFKARVRWDDEENLDLNVRGTNYCENLLYYKVKEKTSNEPVKRFYYRSTKWNGSIFQKTSSGSQFSTLRHPTTIMDLGPRDEFIKEICIDPTLDPNCSVVRNIGPTSYQNFKEMLGLYINYRLDTNADYGYKDFFSNTGYTSTYPFNTNKEILNGDVTQLISINNEVGIEEFDLQNRYYGQYSPTILDPDDYQQLFKSQSGSANGPMPINFVFDDEGYRVRVCLNEPGRLTESSQIVPFFYWDKKGQGFGEGYGQSWDYSTVVSQRLQGMTYNYAFTGDSTYNYLLFPMTKDYSGNTFTIAGADVNDGSFDVEDTTDVHLNYNNQEEGFTVLHITSGTTSNPDAGTLWIRVGELGGWESKPWNFDVDFILKPTDVNYTGTKQILSTPFLFYFGLRPGATAIDKFIKLFGPKGAFPTQE